MTKRTRNKSTVELMEGAAARQTGANGDGQRHASAGNAVPNRNRRIHRSLGRRRRQRRLYHGLQGRIVRTLELTTEADDNASAIGRKP